MEDSVAVDAKRILLRYGAPITVLDEVPDAKRIEFARAVSRTALPERGEFLRDLLIEEGFLPEDAPGAGRKSRSKSSKSSKPSKGSKASNGSKSSKSSKSSKKPKAKKK